MLDYMHIGASRSGTTWLYQNFVVKHPQLDTPNHKKAIVFWNKKGHMEYAKIRGVPNWRSADHSLEWYKQQFSQAERPGIKLADMTDGNSWIPTERIKELYNTYPNVRITYAIRNPITTIWSHVVKHDKRIDPNAPINSMKKMLTDPTHVYNTHYMENLINWLSVFPSEQLLTYFYTEINDPIPLLTKLSNHVGIDSSIWNKVNEAQLHNVVNVGSRKADIPQQVLDFLVDYHSERIHQMEQFFSVDLSHWLLGQE